MEYVTKRVKDLSWARYVEKTKYDNQYDNQANDVAKHFKILVKNCCNFKIVMLLWYGSHIDGGKK
ncbi:MAG: hypothetical protein HFE31_06490 [Clostridia bacterium]|nr:hypothetical protein [Clostridia bacterium]